MTAILQARAVTKTYGRGEDAVRALRGVDIEIEAGEFLSVMGPSGCGKSTLLHVLGAIARATAGDVLLDEMSYAAMSDNQLADVRRHRVGFVFQLFNLVPVVTVEENVAMPAVIAGRNRAAYREKVDELLEAVRLTEQRRKLPSQLSGGQQQRVAIARALVMQPSVLLADEPTGNLDSESGAEVLALINELHARGQTIVLVTHDLKVATLAQRIVSMRDGALVREERLSADDGTFGVGRFVAVDDDP